MKNNNQKKSGSVEVIKFDITEPPVFKKVQGKDWIEWGVKNSWPDYLTKLYLQSPRHGSIINAKVDYIFGGGLTYDNKNLSPANEAIVKSFIDWFTKESCIIDAIRDGEIFNGVAYEIIWNKKRTKPVELNHIPLARVLTNIDESKYYYSTDWTKQQQDETTSFKVFDPFDPLKPADSQLLVFTQKAPPKAGEPNVYPTPNYQSGIIAIENDIAVGEFDNSNLNNGFTGGALINFNNGEPATPEAKARIVESVKSKTTGSKRAGEIIVAFNEGKDREATVLTLTPSDLDKQNVEVDSRTEKRIFIIHKVTNPALFGIRNEGAISGDNNLVSDYELFQSIYVDGRQAWHEKYINQLAKYFGVTVPVTFKRVKPVAQQIDAAVISAAYTQNEVRKLLDLPTIEAKKSDSSKEIINSLNSLSPLVANKVLEKLSDAEIRSLIGLGVGTPQAMSSHEDVSFIFSKYGKPKSEYTILKSQEFNFESPDDTIYSEIKFAKELTGLQKNIIDLINKDNKLTIESLADALKSDVKTIKPIYQDLVSEGYLAVKDGETKATSQGKEIIKEEKPKTKDYEVVYGYDWRAGFSDRDLKDSRDFCKDLMEKNLLYTRSEIDLMSNEMGLPVWEYKGGWTTKKGTDVSVKYCRHTWHQYLVKRK